LNNLAISYDDYVEYQTFDCVSRIQQSKLLIMICNYLMIFMV